LTKRAEARKGRGGISVQRGGRENPPVNGEIFLKGPDKKLTLRGGKRQFHKTDWKVESQPKTLWGDMNQNTDDGVQLQTDRQGGGHPGRKVLTPSAAKTTNENLGAIKIRRAEMTGGAKSRGERGRKPFWGGKKSGQLHQKGQRKQGRDGG